MRITVRYFARLREALGISDEVLDLPETELTAGALLSKLQGLHAPAWEKLPGDLPLLCSVNLQMARPEARVRDGDEVGVFPPVTGG